MSLREYKTQRSKNRKELDPERLLALHYDNLTSEHRRRIRTILTIRQNGKCAICDTQDEGKRKFGIDHDHSSGHVRGLLCGRCNTLLGFARDNILILAEAIKYLEQDRERNFQ